MRKRNIFQAVILLLVLGALMLPVTAQTFTVLHQFNNNQTDGAFSEGAILRDAAGNLYGTTTNPASVFKIDSRGRESVLHFLNAPAITGTFPTGSLIQDRAGNLYGVAEGGPGAGVIYKIAPNGDETVVFAFPGGLNVDVPELPTGGLFMDASGNIFGTAQFGSDQSCQIGCGSIFKLDTAGRLQLLHRFTGGADGANPIGPLVQDVEGNFYGVAQGGGDLSCPQRFLFEHAGCGVVFKLDRNLNLTVLHTFTGKRDGAVPQGGLLLDAAGNLFGTAFIGGKTQHGTVFKIAKDGTYKVLHRFIESEGRNPNGGLVADPAGNLYGTAQLGGNHGLGTAFQIAPNGSLKVLHHFQGLEDGADPFAGLFRDAAGHLYGTTVKNFLIQQVQGGNVFEITP